MSYPSTWSGRSSYYPVGNTPPVNLFQDLAPEEKANVLLLGCGDTRHVLFSLFTREKASIQAPIDITCCDIEPAVLARNIILFTILLDYEVEEIKHKLWNVTFNMYLDQPSHDLFIKHCEKLLKCSNSIDEWHESTYSSVLSFCSQDSLNRIRTMWQAWFASSTLTPKQRAIMSKDFRQQAKNSLSKLGTIPMTHASRAAGPLILDSTSILGKTPQQYWQTGLVGPYASREDCKLVNPTFYYTSQADFNVEYAMSPLQAFHLARSLAPLEPVIGVHQVAAVQRENAPSKPDIKLIEADAFDQFCGWCTAARKMLLQPQRELKPRIRFFVGDCLAFCFALRAYSRGFITSGQYVNPWTNIPIVLDGNDHSASAAYLVPTSFNVIETSNLSDHLGILNLLAATIPLLSHDSPSSVLYTESLQRGTMKDSLSECLGIDFVIFQVLFGVSPVGTGLYVTSQSTGHESLLEGVMNQSHNITSRHERVGWKDVAYSSSNGVTRHSSATRNSDEDSDYDDLSRPAQYTLNHGELSAILASIYHNMFKKENWEAEVGYLGSNMISKGWYGSLEYIRSSFVALLLIVRERLFPSFHFPSIATSSTSTSTSTMNWEQVTDMLLALVCANDEGPAATTRIGLMHFDDLYCQLHLHGLIDLKATARRLGIEGLHIGVPGRDNDGPKPTSGRLSRWKTPLPMVVRVVLVVPKAEMSKDEVLSKLRLPPPLICYIKRGDNSSKLSMFSSIHIVFGRVISGPGLEDDGSGKIVIEEDASGVRGKSALVVSFWVPTHLLLPHTSHHRSKQQRQVEIGLSLHPSPGVMEKYSARLGPELRIFSTNVEDKEHLYFSGEMPPWVPSDDNPTISRLHNVNASSTNNKDQKSSSMSSSLTPSGSYIQITFIPTVAMYTAHIDLANHPNRDLKTSLLNGAGVSYEQLTACKVIVRFAEYELGCTFPSPVNGEAVKIRIARKSSYIEVIAPTFDPEHQINWKKKGITAINRFPVVRVHKNIFTSWNMHHVVLDSLPTINFSVPDARKRLEWYHVLQSLAYSDREANIRDKPAHDEDPDAFDTVVRLKDNLLLFFQHIAGLISPSIPRTYIFYLLTPGGDGGAGKEKAHTAILVNAVRLDLSAHTIVADAFILPITDALKKESLRSPALRDALRHISTGSPSNGLMYIRNSRNEVVAWQKLLAACVERCRQWSHNPDTCEYLSSAESSSPGSGARHAPLSYEANDAPICSCGQGKDAATFVATTPGNSEFKSKFGDTLAILAPYVTRVAISPIYAVSYLEEMGSRVGMAFGDPVTGSGSRSSPATFSNSPWTEGMDPKELAEADRAYERLDGCITCGLGGKGDRDSMKLMTCGKCKRVRYCSAACQKADWKRHKMGCTPAVVAAANSQPSRR